MSNLKADKGDSITLQGTVKRFNHDTQEFEVTDITGGKMWFTAKRNYEDEDADAVIRKGTSNTGLVGVTITDAVNGRFVVDILPSETENLEEGIVTLVWDVQLLETTSQLTTVDKGRFLLLDQVTFASS